MSRAELEPGALSAKSRAQIMKANMPLINVIIH